MTLDTFGVWTDTCACDSDADDVAASFGVIKSVSVANLETCK